MNTPGVARAVRRRKFSDAYQHTHIYAWRRVWKAARHFRSTIVELLRSRLIVKHSDFPYKCFLCGLDMTSAEDRLEWHGLGNCVEICEGCMGSGEADGDDYPNADRCGTCDGRGWFPMPSARV